MSAERPAPRAILFDLDGTLVDTAPDLAGALNRVRADDGLPPLPLDSLRAFASQGARGLLREGLQLHPGDEGYEGRRERFLSYYRADLARHSRPFGGFDDLLAAIEQAGLCWGVVTNKPGWLTEPLLDALALRARCACVVSGDAAARPKPAPDPLLLACRRLQLRPSDCLYVGDDRRDIAAARACRMPVAVALWGYYEPGDDPQGWGADAVLRTPADLQALLPGGRESSAATD